MLIFLFGEFFPPLIILNKIIKKKKGRLLEVTVPGGRGRLGEMGWWGFLSTLSCPSGLGILVPVLPWQGTGCIDGGNSAWAWSGWGDTTLLLLHAGSGRTCCAGVAAKHTCEQGEDAEPCLKTLTYMKFLMP